SPIHRIVLVIMRGALYMEKIGRNDPCHCGSGKKYKKCCMEKDSQSTDTHPTTKTQKTPKDKAHNKVKMMDLYEKPISFEEVSKYSTEKIRMKLNNMGIPFNEQEFSKDVNVFFSAKEIADRWIKRHYIHTTTATIDFLQFAARILWERLAPKDNKSMEQLHDMYIKGEEYLAEKNPTAACDVWLEMWEALKYRMTPSCKDLSFFDKHYANTFFIGNYCQDLEMKLQNAGNVNPIYFEKRIQYCREFCTSFPNEEELYIHNMRRAIADSHSFMKKYEQAEKEFEQIVKDYPHNPWGYI